MEEFIMASINVNEMNEELTISNEEMAHVKGGAAYIKFDGVDGESRGKDHKGWSDLATVTYTRS
jgi:type VI protein secretion system component Hcp